MAQIGEFTRTKRGYRGTVRTLCLDRELVLVPADQAEGEGSPDFRIHLGDETGPEVGAGWRRVGEKAGDYVSLSIDDPTLSQPFRANLFQWGDDKTSFVLLWTRAHRHPERE